MDAHAFRIIGSDILRLLSGARVEKIHGPHPGALVFSLFTHGIKCRFVVRLEGQQPVWFLTTTAIANPLTPPNIVMRLRKYVGGHRLGKGESHFSSRQMVFPVLTDSVPGPEMLLFSLGAQVELVRERPAVFSAEPLWPDAACIGELANCPWQKKRQAGPWQKFPLLTPLLRESLAALDVPDALALMVDLEAGGDTLFLYEDAAGRLAGYCAWPLPDELLLRRGWKEVEEAEALHRFAGGFPAAVRAMAPHLCLSSLVDEAVFFGGLGEAVAKTAMKPVHQENKRLARLARTLEHEEERLQGLLAQREDARLLQAALWQFGPEEKRAEVWLGEESALRRVVLDPRLTVRENMTRMFRQSARGARGLAHLAERMRVVEALQNRGADTGADTGADAALGMHAAHLGSTALKGQGRATSRPGSGGQGAEMKDVARFVSSEGFVMLRGKNAKGNQRLLKIGQPHDLWLHTKDGPSAHVIVRRAHGGDDVPEETLREAAVLVGQRSWQQHDARAEIMVAMLRHVHAVKGASPGTVRVDVILQTLVVPLEQENVQ